MSHKVHHQFAVELGEDIPWYPRTRFMGMSVSGGKWMLLAVQAREGFPGAGASNYTFKLFVVRLGLTETEARALGGG